MKFIEQDFFIYHVYPADPVKILEINIVVGGKQADGVLAVPGRSKHLRSV